MARKEDSKVTRRVASRMDLTSHDIFDFPSRPKNIFWYLTHRFLFRGLGIVRLETWDNKLKRFVADPKNGIPQTPEARTSTRGNMTSQIFSEDESMSVSNFVKAAAVVGVEEIEILVMWKMPDGKRVVGKVRYPLTPDVILSLKDDDEEVALIAQVNEYLQQPDSETTPLKRIWRKLINHKKSKSAPVPGDAK